MRRLLTVAAMVLLTAGVVTGGTIETEVLDQATLAPSPSSHPGFFVTNDAAHPVPVSVLGTRFPFQQASTFTDWGNSRFRSFTFDTPPGKMVVLESVSISAVVESGQKVRADVILSGNARNTNEFGVNHHFLTLEHVDGFGPKDVYSTDRAVAGYAAGSEAVTCTVERNSDTGNGGLVSCTFSGYLLDSPPEPAR